MNKATILTAFTQIPENSTVLKDASVTKEMALDVIEIINNFIIGAEKKNIQVPTKGFPLPKIDVHDPAEPLKSYVVKAKLLLQRS